MRESDFDGAKALRIAIKTRERVLFAILIHGPSAAFDHLKFIREIYKTDNDAFLEIKQALIGAGMEHGAIMEMVLGRHEIGCACWRCIQALHGQVWKSYIQRIMG